MSRSIVDSFGHKAKCAILLTSENNIPVRRLYEIAGFRKVGYGGYIAAMEHGKTFLLSKFAVKH